MTFSQRCLSLIVILALLAPGLSVPARATMNDIIGAAAVYPDGRLRVGRHRIHLYGVYIPATGKQCRTFLDPVYCGNRTAVALDSKI